MIIPVSQDEPLHVIPEHRGEPEHDTSKDCWCEPELQPGPGPIYVHKRVQ